MEAWSPLEVSQWIGSLGIPNFGVFNDENVSGDLLMDGGHDLLKALGISFQDRVGILSAVLKYRRILGLEDEEVGVAQPSPVMYENQLHQMNALKRRLEEKGKEWILTVKEYVVNTLEKQLKELSTELQRQKLHWHENSHKSLPQRVSRGSFKSAGPPSVTSNSDKISLKQEQILRSAMELYGGVPKQKPSPSSAKSWF